ncbi:MAG: methyltransferase domain-containing protein [Pirellulaceae bacterium]|nr:methyltransferase domain-containing protein [Pirellulaceae bacterium]
MQRSATALADRLGGMRVTVQKCLRSVRQTAQFALAWMARPGEVASLVPSSRALHRRLTHSVQAARAQSVIELGPGIGNTTRALLRGLDQNATLVAVEIVPEFAEVLRQIDDSRLIVVQGDASDLDDVMRRHGLESVDMIVSGVPFSTMDQTTASSLLTTIHSVLKPGGIFLAYQLLDSVAHYASKRFGRPKVSYVWWNLPPLRIFRWSQTEQPSSADTELSDELPARHRRLTPLSF